ncbi:hypothetical protein [Nonomuraea sp. SBT364]|uniref:hypothetical protein n=1 Tax=Nonomuraea sp. SBT364 TaxID=1580530 RepID=UPI00066C5373|nr:hypothetical protein [Nonomuraea sp. SBT364]
MLAEQGVFHDYYRAANRQAAAEKPDSSRAVEKPLPGAPAFDAVDAKWIDPGVIFGQLIALVRNVPFSSDLVQTITVYPPREGAPATVEEREALPEDSPASPTAGWTSSLNAGSGLRSSPACHRPMGALWTFLQDCAVLPGGHREKIR